MAKQLTRVRGSTALPDYAPLLDAYHRAYAAELAEIVGTLLLQPGDRVLDLACGDGFYARLLSDLVGAAGLVWAIDLSPDWLEHAKASDCPSPATRGYCQADATQLPFSDDSFDLVWCAQSFYSLPSPSAAVREMVRVARPGGVVGVLENDTLHQFLLPWPVDLELEVRVAELRAFAGETSRPGKYYVGRRLSGALLAEGLEHVGEKAWATTRQAPWSEADRTFLGEYLDNLRRRVLPVLDDAALARLDAWLGDDDGHWLIERPDFTTVWLDRLCWGIKPGVLMDAKKTVPRAEGARGTVKPSDQQSSSN
ncbi:MAG TPA: methyltransferase domain-containing protein [Pirellulales bacterium]|jgi:SAM-dependent methyltransferase|nr:methyltransferase domain-containing protein [Pirellulales bacterium]